MSTMIERLCDVLSRRGFEIDADMLHYSDEERPNSYKALVVAVLEAMREPTEEMRTAMRLANMNITGGYGGPSGWEAAIDAALKEGQ